MTLFLQWFLLLSIINFVATTAARFRVKTFRSIIVSTVTISFVLSLMSWFLIMPVAMTNYMIFIVFLSLFCSHASALDCLWDNFKYIVALWVAVICFFVYSSTAVFQSKILSSQLQPIEIDSPLFTEISDQEQRLVPSEIALDKQSKVINGRMGDGTIISSFFDLEESSSIIQSVNKEKLYITPLTWNGFLKWLNNDKDGIGYALTNSSNPDAKTELVTKNPDGTDIQFKITKTGYFSSNLERHLLDVLGNDTIIENSYLMLDDNEYQYYVSYLVKSVVGFGNYIPDGVAITDPQTKQVERYSQDEIPDFIDSRADEKTLLKHLSDWGYYRNGFLKSFTAGTKIKATTYNNKSEMFFIDARNTENGLAFFTGLEGENKKNKSLSGMLFIDPITLQSYIYYPKSESQNETAVLDSVKASLGNLSDKWKPTQPIPYRIFGDIDVWMTPIIPIEGTSRKVEAYAYTRIFDSRPSAWDKKLSNAMSKLLTSSSDSGQILNSESTAEVKRGNVRTIYFIDGSAYLTLYDFEKLIECNHQTNVECRGIKSGQEIDINVLEKSEKEMVLVGFNKNPILM